MSSERKDTLKKRLDENYTDFIESLQEKTVSELIAMAPEITAAQQLHTELLDACDDEDMEFLLRFDDPLEVVRGYWESEITGYDHSEEMGRTLWRIREDRQDEFGQQEVKAFGKDEITLDPVMDFSGREITAHIEIGFDVGRRFQVYPNLDDSYDLYANVVSFRHDGVTCLLFPFGDTELNIGKFAMWRIQTHDRYGGTWLSDYVPNRLGGFVHEPPRQKPTMSLTGMDGNIFAVMGKASSLLKEAGMGDLVSHMVQRVTTCGDYSKALNIISEYVETELSPPAVPQKSQKKKGTVSGCMTSWTGCPAGVAKTRTGKS